MKPALIIGSTCVDVIINIHHLPKTEEDIHPTSQSMAIGGCAFNAAYMVRLLNAPHTFITPVGGGTYGDYVAKLMTQAGIPIAVRVPEKENGCCYCLVEAGGERTFMSYHGVEYTFQKSWMEPYQPDSYGLTYVWQRTWLKLAGTVGLLGVTIGFHGIYNLLIAYGGRVQYVAYLLPTGRVLLGLVVRKVFLPRMHAEPC